MPRAPWHRRTNDSPRPAGRRWTGTLRRGGSVARRALITRVVHRRRLAGPVTAASGLAPATLQQPTQLDVPRRRYARFRPENRRSTAVIAGPREIAEIVGPIDIAPEAADEIDVLPRAIPLLPGERTLSRRIKFGIVNGATIASLMLGLSAIFLSMHHDPRIAAALLVGCVVFDGIDGALARKFGVACPFGAQMDSMADMCSFGLAAPVVVYASMNGEVPSWAIAIACGMITACAAIRLARFNVSPKDGRFFNGIPTTMAAAVMGIAVLIGLRLPGPVAVLAVALLAIAMVSAFPYAKLARLLRLPVWIWIAPAAGLLVNFQATFSLLVAVYLVSGPFLWLRQRQQGRVRSA